LKKGRKDMWLAKMINWIGKTLIK